MSDEDQFWSMRAAAYEGVLRAAAALTQTGTTRTEAAVRLLSLEQAIEAARLYVPEPLDQALVAMVDEARRWDRVAAANSAESTVVKEAGTTVKNRLSKVRALMRDEARPAPAARYADDSTLLARRRIAYAREKPLAKQEEALNAGWPQILSAAAVELVVSVIWLTVWFKAAAWLIGTYWWTNLPAIDWLPAAGLAFVVKLLLLKTPRTAEPFLLPTPSRPTREQATSAAADDTARTPAESRDH
jgi:hypothetical protein